MASNRQARPGPDADDAAKPDRRGGEAKQRSTASGRRKGRPPPEFDVQHDDDPGAVSVPEIDLYLRWVSDLLSRDADEENDDAGT